MLQATDAGCITGSVARRAARPTSLSCKRKHETCTRSTAQEACCTFCGLKHFPGVGGWAFKSFLKKHCKNVHSRLTARLLTERL